MDDQGQTTLEGKWIQDSSGRAGGRNTDKVHVVRAGKTMYGCQDSCGFVEALVGAYEGSHFTTFISQLVEKRGKKYEIIF